jgi:DNA modification methylase
LRDYGVSGQIGLESSPEAYVARLVEVFREVKRVLKDEGTLWLNLGDSYATNGGSRSYGSNDGEVGRGDAPPGNRTPPSNLKPKDLIGIPWRLAFALQSDGWYLRSDIIWHKPNCMPESCKDRPTKCHEYMFLLSKGQKYYYDGEAIKEDNTEGTKRRLSSGPVNPIGKDGTKAAISRGDGGGKYEVLNGRNKRTVWTIPTKPYREAHFATFPEALVEPCILAGTSEKGYCPACGKAWERQVEKSNSTRTFPDNEKGIDERKADGTNLRAGECQTKTIGWLPSCKCPCDPIPGIVLDPFFGAGTVGVVAKKLGRIYVGIELNPDYVAIAKARIASIPARLDRWLQ